MSNSIDIPYTSILKEGQTIRNGGKNYIIYLNPEDSKYQVHINAYYIKRGSMVEICMQYDRSLCRTLREYYSLNPNYIESQAYGAYMDGAR